MKYLKKTLKAIIIIIGIVLTLIILDYIRLNISYIIKKQNYIEVANIYGNKYKYAPQGLTYSEKYNVILQTSYNKNNVSMLYIINFDTGKLIKELKLIEIDDKDNKNHVGGIATNEEKVWITNDYEINEYNLEEIITTNNNYIKSIKNTKLPNRGDFCTYNNNTLWIGDFYLKPFYNVPNDTPLLLGYEISENIDYNKPKYTIKLPKMVQGMAITPENNFIFTRSYTNLINSDLVIYSDMTKEYKKIKSIKLPPMAEGIFYKDNELYILFENSSDKYFFAYPKIKKIIKISV